MKLAFPKKIKSLTDLGIKRDEVVLLHRGRNKHLTNFFIKQSYSDYNYDFRGLKVLPPLNIFFHVIKSFITSLEIERGKIYVLEGGLFIIIGLMLKVRDRKNLVILNIADPTLYSFRKIKKSMIKNFIKVKILSLFDGFITNSEMVQREYKSIFPNKKNISRYYLPVFYDKAVKIEKNNIKDKVLFLITRPRETGYIKGLEIFEQIVSEVGKHKSQLTFFLAGAGTENLSFNGEEKITKLGHLHEIKGAYKKVNIIICPSIYDCYPSVSVECIEYGVLPIVSVDCGSAIDIRKIDANLVVENTLNIGEWTEKIFRVNKYSTARKSRVLKKFKTFASKELIFEP